MHEATEAPRKIILSSIVFRKLSVLLYGNFMRRCRWRLIPISASPKLFPPRLAFDRRGLERTMLR